MTASVVNVDDPQVFNHRFADVNGIRLHFVEEGAGRWSFCCTAFLTSGIYGCIRSRSWPRPAIAS